MQLQGWELKINCSSDQGVDIIVLIDDITYIQIKDLLGAHSQQIDVRGLCFEENWLRNHALLIYKMD